MTRFRLLTVPEAAEILGLPQRSLLREARRHGHLVQVGRAQRIPEHELAELIDKCRSQPKGRASSSDDDQDANPSGSSRTAALQSAAQARQIVAGLKSRLPNTSPLARAAVVPLHLRK